MEEISTKIYQKLFLRLKRAGFQKTGVYRQFPHAGYIVSFLFELFLSKKGVVFKSDLIAYKIVKEGETYTNDFLRALSHANFIVWSMEDNKKSDFKHYQVFPGSKLKDILKEIDKNQKADFEDLLRLDIRVSKLENALKYLINKFDPPYTENKYVMYINEGSKKWENNIQICVWN